MTVAHSCIRTSQAASQLTKRLLSTRATRRRQMLVAQEIATAMSLTAQNQVPAVNTKPD